MSVLICGDPALVETIRPCLQGFRTRQQAGLAPPGPDVIREVALVVAALPVVQADHVTELRRLRGEMALAELVLVTRPTARAIRGLACDPELLQHLVGLEEATRALPECINALLTSHYLERAADLASRIVDLPPSAKWFLKRAWSGARPPTSVTQAAGDIGISLSTLRENWPIEAPPRTVVEWAILGRALMARRGGASWVRAAYLVRVTKRRLERIARRRTGRDLQELDDVDEEMVERKFKDWLTSVLPPTPLSNETVA